MTRALSTRLSTKTDADLSKRSVRPSPQLREKLCVAKAKAKSPYLRQTDRQNDMVSYTTRQRYILRNAAMPGMPLTPRHKSQMHALCGDDDTPL